MKSTMPLVTIKTGTFEEGGREVILTEYLCDWPDCGNVAEHALGVALDLGMASAVCKEHFPKPGDRAADAGSD